MMDRFWYSVAEMESCFKHQSASQIVVSLCGVSWCMPCALGGVHHSGVGRCCGTVIHNTLIAGRVSWVQDAHEPLVYRTAKSQNHKSAKSDSYLQWSRVIPQTIHDEHCLLLPGHDFCHMMLRNCFVYVKCKWIFLCLPHIIPWFVLQEKLFDVSRWPTSLTTGSLAAKHCHPLMHQIIALSNLAQSVSIMLHVTVCVCEQRAGITALSESSHVTTCWCGATTQDMKIEWQTWWTALPSLKASVENLDLSSTMQTKCSLLG